MCNRLLSLFKSYSEPQAHEDQRAKDVAYWTSFWPELQKAAQNSEEHVDKKVFVLSAGSIGLEVTLLSMPLINKAEGMWLALSAAACFVLTLCINLLIHIRGWRNQAKESDIIRDFIKRKPYAATSDEIYDLIAKHGRIIRGWNVFSSIVLIIGIAFLFAFTFRNLF